MTRTLSPLRTVGEQVEAAFDRIAASRMRDFPLSNPALRVRLVGLRDWSGVRIGVLISPWSINLLLLPGAGGVDAGGFRRLGPDQQQHWTFPSGSYAFYGLDEQGIGPYQTCSLFSPALEFSTQAAAEQTAEAVMLALFRDASALPDDADGREGDTAVSRRDLLRGRLSAGLEG
ncbi:MAG: [NiFe]-hydrogenase assembly chaperone HybE [Nevskiales bacterium]|nr:[NiFe]-hydrogenase assembly chaperone HybE [Nevskiales bacterium]